jgi:hypothetical protein
LTRYPRAPPAGPQCMEIVGLVLIPLAVAVVVRLATVAVRSVRSPKAVAPVASAGRPAPTAPVGPSPTEPPTFRVLALGTAGSGKTVLLSTLFHALNYPAPGRSYHLETDPHQRLALSRLYGAVRDTDRPWPDATSLAAREFTFDCVGTDPRGDRQVVLRMRYHDYGGELLEADEAANSAHLDVLMSHVKEAHALLAMIDGHRVLQLLQGEREGFEHFQHTLQPMLGFMQSASCPIHLIVTKWDLVRAGAGTADDPDDRALFARVVQELMRFDHLKALVHVHSRDQVVRLIPVSAVGPRFAELRADGTVAKRADGELRPTNIEVPLSAVLPDLFKQVEMRISKDDRRRVNALLMRQMRKDAGALVAGVLARPAAMAARTALQGALGADVGAASSALFGEWLLGRSAGSAQLRQARAELESQVDRLQVLREAVLEDFKRTVTRFEAVLPHSELSREW